MGYKFKLKPEDFYSEDSKYRMYLEGMIRDGYSLEVVADKLGIDRRTLYRWAERDSTFATIMRDAREFTNLEIESALKRSCKGFYVEQEMIDKLGHKQKIMVYIPPSVEAQKFWLKNKKAEGWREKVDQVVDTTAIDTLKDILGSLKDNAENESVEPVKEEKPNEEETNIVQQ